MRPLQRRLATLDAWVTGLRRDQDGGRERTEPVAIDEEHGGIVKLSPLAGWSKEQVFSYAREHDVPLHPLYAQGYPSIGCQPCTRKVKAGEDPRAGRWWWEKDVEKECGMHLGMSGQMRREVDVLLDEVLPARKPFAVK